MCWYILKCFFFTANLLELSQVDEEVGVVYFKGNDNLKKCLGGKAYEIFKILVRFLATMAEAWPKQLVYWLLQIDQSGFNPWLG